MFEIIKHYISYAELHTEKKIKMLSIDSCGELFNDSPVPHCNDNRIFLRVTARQTPQQNGEAEQEKRSITTKARAIFIQSGLSQSF